MVLGVEVVEVLVVVVVVVQTELLVEGEVDLPQLLEGEGEGEEGSVQLQQLLSFSQEQVHLHLLENTCIHFSDGIASQKKTGKLTVHHSVVNTALFLIPQTSE
jgi:hypothetical protein